MKGVLPLPPLLELVSSAVLFPFHLRVQCPLPFDTRAQRKMEDAVELIMRLLCGSAASVPPCDVAGIVGKVFAQLLALWVETVDTGRVAAASASREAQLLLFTRELEPIFQRCALLCDASQPSSCQVQDACSLSDAAFASVRVRVLFLQCGSQCGEGCGWVNCSSLSLRLC